MFTKKQSSGSGNQLTQIWAGISATMTELEGQTRRLEIEVDDMAEALQMKLDGMIQLAAQLAKDKGIHVEEYSKRCAAGPVASVEDDAFWARLADLDLLIEKTSKQIDDARLRIYFPAARGYLWRLAVPGLYAAISDFWLDHFAVKTISLEAKPGRGDCWEAGSTPPTVTLTASGISLSLHVDELGLRGEQVPTHLRRVRQLDLEVDAELFVSLAFEAPAPPKAGGSSSAGWGKASAGGGLSPPNASRSLPIDRLMGFEWRVLDSFRFEVTRLEVRSKGTGALGVPAGLLKYLINAYVPGHVKAALQAAVPPELGVMLALHADHQVALSGQIIVQSLPFDMLTVPLDQAVDTSLSHGSTVHAGSATAGASALTGARAVLNHVYSSQIAEQEALHRHIEHVARLGGASTPAGRAAATAAPARVSAGSRLPGFQSTLAAAALGLTPSQARAFVSAQAAVPTLKGTPHLRSLHDVLRFIAVYNPRSRFRVAQRAAHSNVISSALVRSGTDVGAANDKLWAQLLDGFQRLIEEYIQEMLAHTYEQALHAPDKDESKRAVLVAQRRAASMHVDMRHLCAAAEEVYAKPTHLHLTLTDLTFHVHAESLVGLVKTVNLHSIRTKVATASKTPAQALDIPVVSIRPPSLPAAVPGRAGAPAATGSSTPLPTSVSAQVEAINIWTKNTSSQIRIFHSFITEASVVLTGWLLGGKRGRVGISLRQLQLWCVPGVSLPVAMAEGFNAPGTMVTVMESSDEPCLGGIVPTPLPSPWHNSPARGTPPPPPRNARGSFSIKLCWPKALLEAGAPQEHALHAALSTSSVKDRRASGADIPRTASETMIETAVDVTCSNTALGLGAPVTLTSADVESLATVKIHRAWAGLLVDDACLINLVQERAAAAAAGSSRGLPPLYALELSFRPASVGSSFTLATPGAYGSANATPCGAFSYVLGVDLPPWVRTLVEVQALEVLGDIQMLSKHFGAILHGLWSAAAAEASAEEDGTVVDDPADIDESVQQCNSVVLGSGRTPTDETSRADIAPQMSPAVQLNFSDGCDGKTPLVSRYEDPKLCDRGSGRLTAVVENVCDRGSVSSLAASLQCDDPVRKQSVASSDSGRVEVTNRVCRTESTCSASLGQGSRSKDQRGERADLPSRGVRALHAAAARNAASFEVSKRLSRYLHSEDLRVEINLHVSAMSLPGMPMLGLSHEHEQGDSPLRPKPLKPHPVLFDIAGIDALFGASAGDGNPDVMRRGQRTKKPTRQVLALQVASFAQSRPTLIPPPGSGLAKSTVAGPDGNPARATLEPDPALPEHAVSDVGESVSRELRDAITAAAGTRRGPDASAVDSNVTTPSGSLPERRPERHDGVDLHPPQVVSHAKPAQSRPPPAPASLAGAAALRGVSRLFAQVLKPPPPSSSHKQTMASLSSKTTQIGVFPDVITSLSGSDVSPVVAPVCLNTSGKLISEPCTNWVAAEESIGAQKVLPSNNALTKVTAMTAGLEIKPEVAAVPLSDVRKSSVAAAQTSDARTSTTMEAAAARELQVAHASLDDSSKSVAVDSRRQPALCIDFQLSVLALLEDFDAVSTAIDIVSQLQQAAADECAGQSCLH